jgi:alginate O-acetyltransferase complex protein AlgI
MTFSSMAFFIFFTIVLIVMAIIKTPVFSQYLGLKEPDIHKVQHSILLIASYIFYGWWDWRFCFLMLFLTIVAYISAIRIEKQKSRSLYIIIGVTVPLVIFDLFNNPIGYRTSLAKCSAFCCFLSGSYSETEVSE